MSCMFVMHTPLRLNELDVGVQSTRIFFTAAAIDLEILKEEVSPSLGSTLPVKQAAMPVLDPISIAGAAW